MKTSTLLSEGARQVLRFRRLIALFYVANLAAAAVVVLPAAAFIGSRLAHSLESDRLFANIDPSWLVETFYADQTAPFTMLGAGALSVAPLFLLLTTFLAGGTLAVFHRENDTFFGGCARFFLRLLRVLLVSLLFYGVLLAINKVFNVGLARLKQDSMVARPWDILSWVWLLVMLFLFGTVNMIFDYAKIVCVVENRRSAVKATGAALKFVFGNLGRSLSVYWSCTLFGFLLLLLYHGISELVGQGSATTVVLLLIIRQVYMLTRMWTRLWTWSSEVRFYTVGSIAVAPGPRSFAAA